MGEIRFVGTGETHGYPYLVCKKRIGDTCTHVILEEMKHMQTES